MQKPGSRQDYDLIGSYDNQRYTPINAERTVNLFEYLDPNGKRPKVLLPTAGLVNADLGLGEGLVPSRASFVYINQRTGRQEIYQVFGSDVYLITGVTGALVVNKIGELKNVNGNVTTVSGYVGVDANTYQVIFVDGEEGWIWDINAQTFRIITDPAFPVKPLDVCYLDGFFLVINGDTNNFQLSSINQGMVWGGASTTFTADDTTDELTLPDMGSENFATGVPVTVSTTGTLPSPLVAGTTYYAIRIGVTVNNYPTNPGVIKLATTYDNAINGIAIDLLTAGTPTNTIAVTGQLQLGSVTSHPGTLVACKTLHRRIFLFSQNFTEVWENAGIGTNLPFRRNNSLLMEVGTPAIASVAQGFDRMFFLAQDQDGLAGVMEVRGTESLHVSNSALDYQLAQYAATPGQGVADGWGILTKENGIIFYRLNFTLANHTFVLNVSMSTADMPKWHEEEVLNGDRHPGQTHAYFDGVNYYGDYKRPVLYAVDSTVMTNDSEHIRRMRIGRQMTPVGYNRLRIDRFQVDLLQGQADVGEIIEVDLFTEAGESITTETEVDIILEEGIDMGGGNPIVYLTISKDGGQSYGNILQATMGKIGERTYRTVWRKLGTTPRGQGFVPKIQFFNDVPFVVLGAAWDFEDMPE